MLLELLRKFIKAIGYRLIYSNQWYFYILIMNTWKVKNLKYHYDSNQKYKIFRDKSNYFKHAFKNSRVILLSPVMV